jgi:hypothetical protein
MQQIAKGDEALRAPAPPQLPPPLQLPPPQQQPQQQQQQQRRPLAHLEAAA